VWYIYTIARHLGTIARRLPVVPNSAEDCQDMTTQSRRSGNRSHKTASPKPRAAESASGAPRADASLAARLREFLRGVGQPRRRADVLEAVLDATSSTRVPERMAANVVGLAVDWLGGEGWAMLAAQEGNGLHWLADRGVIRGQRAAMTAAADQAVNGSKVIWLSGDGSAGRGLFASIVAIPVKSHGRPVAALVGLDLSPAPRAAEPVLDERRLAPLLALADAIGGPLDSAVRLKRANALSAIDDLTGLYNSRFLDGALRREVKRSIRTGRPLSLLFVDLDGFKGINDRYGHLSGSRALVEAAERIQSGARETDLVARFGGDEFSLILPDTGRAGAMLVARRVRERVASHPFLAREGVGYRLTASVGAATLCDAAGTSELLLAAADAAMYRVKGRGKDGIEMADFGPPSK
jgi:diguanylate cyclase (GGDEF)-like protein